MKEKLIEILETMGYPAYLQGSMSEDDEYRESFFTFWNFDTEEIRHYNNKATFISYGFWVYFYSVNPALVENVMKEIVAKLKENRFLITVAGMETAKPKKEDRRVRYTKQAIRDGFLRLLAEKPIEKISVTEICREADINRGTFYAHYSDPYELKRSLEDQLSDALAQRLQESGLKRLTSLQTLRLLSENRELCRVFVGPYGDHDAMLKVIAKHADDYLEQEILTLGDVSETFSQCLKQLLVSSISTVVKYWLDTGMKAAPERVAYVLDTYCARGIQGFLNADSPL